MRANKALVAVALAACLVLSGCVGGAGTGALASATQGTAANDATANDTTTTVADDGSVIDGEQIVDDHEAALDDADSYTFELSTSSTDGDGDAERSVDRTAYVDAETGERLVRSDFEDGTKETYVSESGDRYARTDASDEDGAEYYRPSEYEVATSWNHGVESVVDELDFEPTGTTTIDGERVRTYVAETDEPLTWESDSDWTWYDEMNVTATDVELAVGESGVIRELSYTTTVELDDET